MNIIVSDLTEKEVYALAEALYVYFVKNGYKGFVKRLSQHWEPDENFSIEATEADNEFVNQVSDENVISLLAGVEERLSE